MPYRPTPLVTDIDLTLHTRTLSQMKICHLHSSRRCVVLHHISRISSQSVSLMEADEFPSGIADKCQISTILVVETKRPYVVLMNRYTVLLNNRSQL